MEKIRLRASTTVDRRMWLVIVVIVVLAVAWMATAIGGDQPNPATSNSVLQSQLQLTATPVSRLDPTPESDGPPMLHRFVVATVPPFGRIPELEPGWVAPATATPDVPPDVPTAEPEPADGGANTGAAAPEDPAAPPPQPAGGGGGKARPVRVIIPRIGVDAGVESVGLTATRAMAAPRGWNNVGWFNLGVPPGQFGNAVMAGHVDDSSGAPAVFWRLKELGPGDRIKVINSDGSQHEFEVDRLEVFPQGQLPMRQVFGMVPSRNLNLTTCHGTWDRGRGTYTERLVAFSHLVGYTPGSGG